MKRLFAALLLLAAAASARATDIPFGGDTLHYLIVESDAVVQGRLTRDRAVAFGPVDDRYVRFRIAARSIAKGERLAPSTVPFGVPAALPIRTRGRGEVMVFLKRVNGPTAQALLVPTDTNYVAVSGGYGVIDLRPSGRLEAIQSLIAAGEQTSLHRAWAETYFTNSDPLLQRSSIHLAYDDLSEAWAPALLQRAVATPAVSLENRDLALEMLLEAQAPGTREILRRLAEDRSAPLFLRTSAVRGVRRLPGGEADLRAWSGSRDAQLRAAVAAVAAEPR
jgi:hypothetical protein